MSAAPFTSRVQKVFRKTITFTGAAGLGAIGTVAIGTVTGSIWLRALSIRCTTSLVGATATVEVGDATNTAALVAQTTATNIDAGEFWQSATPGTIVSPVLDNMVLANIIITVATAAVTAGVLEITYFWHPSSSDGQLA